MLATTVFQDLGRDAITMDQNVVLLIVAPLSVASLHFIRMSAMWAEKSPPSFNTVARRQFLAPIAANLDTTPYALVSVFHASAAVPSILMPKPTGFLQL
ncbi:hypothetical protein C0992_008403 [Termitomyces sp. T32_za158]|nr:hypothetical protein C0992_008403 [Termitomyces sp. T32_za158]